MKIIAKDNFDRDTVSDIVIAENVNQFYAPIIAAFLQEKYGGDHADRFFTVKGDDYKPYKWEP